MNMISHVVYVCADPGVPVFGQKGCSIHVQEILRALKFRANTITLLCSNQGGEIPRDLQNINVLQIPRLPDQSDSAFTDSIDSLVSAISHHLDALNPIDLIYERHSLWSYAAMEWAAIQGIPACLEVNAPLIEEQKRYRSLLHPQLAQQCVARAYSSDATIIAVSSQVATYIRSICPHTTRVHVVHNGVDLKRFHPSLASSRQGQTGIEIGFCGSLRPWHGVLDLVEAFSLHTHRHPDSRLTIIGDGPIRHAIQQRIKSHGLEQVVRMSGKVPPEAIPEYLAELDVGVAPYPNLPDLYFSPLKLFEYLAAGLCAVAPFLGDIPLLLEPDVTGVLYNAGDIQGLSAVFDRLSENPELRSSIAQQGRQQALNKHSWDRVLDKTLDLVFP